MEPEPDDSTAASGAPLPTRVGRRIRTTQAVAVAGLLYAALSVSTRQIMDRVPRLDDPELVGWFEDERNQELLLLALSLTSFSTVMFLWFVAVIRRQVGDREDQFFATVFVGSGIVLIVSTLLATAASVSPAIGARLLGAEDLEASVIAVSGGLGGAVSLVVAPRMQAVFVASTSTVIFRTGALPTWLALAGYALAAVMFVTPFLTEPLGVAFPIWVAVVSVVILFTRPQKLAGR